MDPMRGGRARAPAGRATAGPATSAPGSRLADDRRAEADRLARAQEAASSSGTVQRIGALQGAVGGVIQRKPVDELVAALGAALPGTDRLSKAEIIEGLRRLAEADRTDPNFARALVEFVKQRNGSAFDITDLAEAPDAKWGKKHLTKRWTFRHYTNEKFPSIQSLADLEAQGIDASKNTNDRDWEELGNQGYVFGLVAVDGKVPSRTWLSTMKYYAEYDLRDLPSIWVSADMLTPEGRTKGSFQGAGEAVIAQLSRMLGFQGQNEAQAIDAQFDGTLEAKVPPAHLADPVWQDNG